MIHMIRRQYMHVELNGTEAEGMELQRRLPALCHQWLTPAIEQSLERCTPSEGYLTIERLEIDIGTVTLDNLEQELPPLVALALETTIREKWLRETIHVSTLEDSLVHQKTASRSMHEALVYFLETGSLPWSFRLPEGVTLEQALLNSWQEAEPASESARAVRDGILPALASATVRQRLIRQFSPPFFDTLLSLLSPAAKRVVDRIVPVLHSAAVSSAAIRVFEWQLWENVFAAMATGTTLSARRLVGEAWRALPTMSVESTTLASVLERHWPGATGVALGETDRTESRESLPEAEVTPDATSDLPDVDRLSVQRKAYATGALHQHPEAKEGIYIENAGLVLLHPFLARFFVTLGIASGDALVYPERALLLLHFLATGQATAPEYELILPKLLCGLPLLSSVETTLELTAAETEEAEALLNAVIRHWSVLRSTSPDGLRGAFLLRSGKVSLRDDGDWLLQVESSSIDILLGQLPWGISVAKLPWMDKMIWVEWG